jgi:hypothetical protein
LWTPRPVSFTRPIWVIFRRCVQQVAIFSSRAEPFASLRCCAGQSALSSIKESSKPSQILAEIWQASFESADAEAYHSELRSRSHCSHCRLSVLAQQQNPERNQDDHGHTLETAQNACFASCPQWRFLSRDGASHRGGKKCSQACALLYGNEGCSRDRRVLVARLCSGVTRSAAVCD